MTSTYTTRTNEFGQITFSAPAATTASDGYIWMEAAGGRRLQICDGGDFFGTTLTATTSDLKKVAQRWMRQRRDWMRAA